MTQSSLGTALITGASAGIGAVYADRLARRGYDLILVARNKERLAELAADLRKQTGVGVETIQADLSYGLDTRRIADRLGSDPAITLLVNNAGMNLPAGLAGADVDRLEQMIQLNVTALTRLAASAATAFATRGHGTIINISSVLALTPEMLNGAYSGTKAYVLNLTISMQQELAARGVRVQAVLPGATRTEFWAKAGTKVDDFPPGILMDAGEMVDAALRGLEQGEVVTIPALPDRADWDAYTEARLKLGPNLSRSRAADRYQLVAA
ncbi:MAG TPA: SDR family oxidoreductase [Acetobacteraceae bacterium]|nr:SDR family oxidoreductase [Acetobacteraceae bacterium]